MVIRPHYSLTSNNFFNGENNLNRLMDNFVLEDVVDDKIWIWIFSIRSIKLIFHLWRRRIRFTLTWESSTSSSADMVLQRLFGFTSSILSCIWYRHHVSAVSFLLEQQQQQKYTMPSEIALFRSSSYRQGIGNSSAKAAAVVVVTMSLVYYV